jgi:hypothetical protein
VKGKNLQDNSGDGMTKRAEFAWTAKSVFDRLRPAFPLAEIFRLIGLFYFSKAKVMDRSSFHSPRWLSALGRCLLVALVSFAVTGCALFSEPPVKKPLTTGEFLKQDRIPR